MQSILIIDNKKEELYPLCLLLSQNGFNYIRKVFNEEAITVIQNEIIHLIILDQMVTPYDWIESSKRVVNYSNIPIIPEEENNTIKSRILEGNIDTH